MSLGGGRMPTVEERATRVWQEALERYEQPALSPIAPSASTRSSSVARSSSGTSIIERSFVVTERRRSHASERRERYEATRARIATVARGGRERSVRRGRGAAVRGRARPVRLDRPGALHHQRLLGRFYEELRRYPGLGARPARRGCSPVPSGASSARRVRQPVPADRRRRRLRPSRRARAALRRLPEPRGRGHPRSRRGGCSPRATPAARSRRSRSATCPQGTQFHPEEWDDEWHPAGRAIIERFVELAGNSVTCRSATRPRH